jgi:hypothetical protein
MVENTKLDGPISDLDWAEWESLVRKSFSKRDLVRMLRHMIEESRRTKRKLLPSIGDYTHRDAISHQGSHTGIQTIRRA